MRDLSQSCIFDDSSKNLNTIMSVTMEGEKYKVAICDTCEDLASPSAIKKLIPVRLEKLDEKNEQLEKLKKVAAELGFDLVKTGTSKLMIPILQDQPATPSPAGEQTLRKTLSEAPVIKMGNGEMKVQKNMREQAPKNHEMTPEEADAAIEAAKRSTERNHNLESATAGEAAAYTSHDTAEPLRIQTPFGEKVYSKPEVFSKENQTVRGRLGIPTTIPKNMQSSDGKTTIKVVNTGGDKALQARARQLGALREHGDGSFYSNDCRPCQGRGFHGATNKPCRTCNGTGIVI